jgi:TnpA family transposase
LTLLLLDQLLGSVDGSKYETKVQTIQSRYSPKYFGLKKGVVALNYLINHAVVNSEVIRPNDHESHFLFDIVRNNTSEIDADAITGDMHSINCLNYVLLAAINKSFTPNYNSPQKESISCMQPLKTYNHCIVQPTKVINEQLIEDEWDNIQRVLTSAVMGNTTQSIIVSKLTSSKRNNKTKRALSEYNEILKSLHILDFIDDALYRSCIRKALNRVEAYHNLRRAIAKVGGGKLSGKSIVENEVWNQCTRLIANAIIFYNGLLLDNVLKTLEVQGQNEGHLECIKNISPISWIHVNLTGKYEFTKYSSDINMQEIVAQFKKYLDATLLKSATHII